MIEEDELFEKFKKEFDERFDGELWVKKHDSGGDDTSKPSGDYTELLDFIKEVIESSYITGYGEGRRDGNDGQI